MSSVASTPSAEAMNSVPARGHRIVSSTHTVERYFERRNDLLTRMSYQEAKREARRELTRLYRRGVITDTPPWWVDCSRRNDFYLMVGENLVFPLAVLEDGGFITLTCLDRGAADPLRRDRRAA